ncbi:MAG: NADH-ubiquinone oxidoreductase-F iron-sulfur binding region domain-containing protein [Chloroflexota bacterium]
MKLTDRRAFDNHVKQCRKAYEQLSSGERWVINIGISEDSRAKGVDAVHAAITTSSGILGEDTLVRTVGSGGWAWADPFITVCGPGHPRILYGPLHEDDVPDLIASLRDGEVFRSHAVGVFGDEPFNGVPPLSDDPFFSRQRRLLSEHWGEIDPTSIDDYLAVEGYQAWIKVLTEMTPEQVIDEVKASGVRGRGGAGFPAGIKWDGGRRAAAEPKYMACNSHEGEPNVYKDRRLLESNPHLVLEGIMIGCYAIGAERGYNYIGGEHMMAVDRFRRAVDQAYEYGLLGENILGTGVNCHIRVRAGGGAYICGEGSALMYSVMGERGQPRTKPPRSVEEGLWRRPTVLNNTETLAPVPAIIRNGGEWYAGIGTERSTGTKLITMQGPLARLGVVEVEMGISLEDLIFEVYGGMAEGKSFKGVQTGGVSAAALTRDQLDVAVDFDELQSYGAMLGSGGFIVFDESVDAVEFGRYLMDFNRWESCAKCTPCRLGNKALVEVVDRILNGNGRQEDLDLIRHTSKHVMELSLCGLGQVAPVPLLGMMDAYPGDFEAYIEGERETDAPPVEDLAAALN